MTERHPGGYRRHDRDDIGKRDPDERRDDDDEIWSPEWDPETLTAQGERCMDCGVATCMGGCPIGNVVPDWNDLVHREEWERALERLHATNNFPEFTGYTCPAPCEDACVLAYNDDPVAIKSIERAIADVGWEEGFIEPDPPETRTGFEVAIVGSGPAGLAAAQQLNRVGHHVTVFERDDEIGGLMTYGIPEFKFAKARVDRRVEQLDAEGIAFETNAEVGEDVPAERLLEFDAACLAVGAQRHRDPGVEGRNLGGVHDAMPYLKQANRRATGKSVAGETIDAAGKNVVVLGGGDTGADCVATAHRQGAEQVVQIGINAKPPADRPLDNPWPEQPKTYEKTYAQEEGATEEFGVDTTAFVDDDGDGRVDRLDAERVVWEHDEAGNRIDKHVVDPALEIPADLALVAVGFEGPEVTPFGDLGLELADDGTLRTDDRMMTAVDIVFAAGDANVGASLVVWAIGEGRDVARSIDTYLTGDSRLPPSIRTDNPPLVDP
ncbi:glutamate synthase subunit beta [Halobellus litoreus]|uniref:Glutamate synthase subunit beta n=1 Tax=Halobellus litoreus TaxID=755310 RepID=A0ABD6DXM8_9EURY